MLESKPVFQLGVAGMGAEAWASLLRDRLASHIDYNLVVIPDQPVALQVKRLDLLVVLEPWPEPEGEGQDNGQDKGRRGGKGRGRGFSPAQKQWRRLFRLLPARRESSSFFAGHQLFPAKIIAYNNALLRKASQGYTHRFYWLIDHSCVNRDRSVALLEKVTHELGLQLS